MNAKTGAWLLVMLATLASMYFLNNRAATNTENTVTESKTVSVSASESAAEASSTESVTVTEAEDGSLVAEV